MSLFESDLDEVTTARQVLARFHAEPTSVAPMAAARAQRVIHAHETKPRRRDVPGIDVCVACGRPLMTTTADAGQCWDKEKCRS